MNTHKVTNKHGGSFEFDCSKHHTFLKLFEWGDGGCGHTNNLACSDCPVPNRGHPGSQCLEFTGTNDAHVKFKGLSIELIEPVSNTYNLLELEEDEEYTCDEFPAYKYRRKDTRAEYKGGAAKIWHPVGDFFIPRTFRKIEKKLTFKDVKMGDILLVPGPSPIEWEAIGYFKDKLVIARIGAASAVITNEISEEKIGRWEVKK